MVPSQFPHVKYMLYTCDDAHTSHLLCIYIHQSPWIVEMSTGLTLPCFYLMLKICISINKFKLNKFKEEKRQTFKCALCRFPSLQCLMLPSFIVLNLDLKDLIHKIEKLLTPHTHTHTQPNLLIIKQNQISVKR